MNNVVTCTQSKNLLTGIHLSCYIIPSQIRVHVTTPAVKTQTSETKKLITFSFNHPILWILQVIDRVQKSAFRGIAGGSRSYRLDHAISVARSTA